MARRGARARSFTPRRSTRPGGTWGRLITDAATLAGATKSTFAGLVLSNAGIGETIRRTVGGFAIRSDQVATAESFNGAVGAMIVSDAATAIGTKDDDLSLEDIQPCEGLVSFAWHRHSPRN